MSENTYPGNPDNFPSAIHKVENGDQPVGPTWQVALEELADRTATLNNQYERTYVYFPANPVVTQTFALNLTSETHVCGIEILLVGGGQAGGNASASLQGRGGMAGCVNRIYIPIVNETNPLLVVPKNLSIVVGGGGANGDSDPGSDYTTPLEGPRGKASYVVDVATGEIFLFAQGGGVELDRVMYPAAAGESYHPPYGKASAENAPRLTTLPSSGFSAYDEVGVAVGGGAGRVTGFAVRGGYRGGRAKVMGVGSAGGQGGRGAGAGGGGGILSTLNNGTESTSGGHGGYGLYPTAFGASSGAQSASVASALGGGGGGGLAIVRVFRRV